jgi:hypothetical protein
LRHPWLFLALLGVFVLLMIWLLPKLWSGIRVLWRRIRALFGAQTTDERPPPPVAGL